MTPCRRWPTHTDHDAYAHADVDFHLAIYAASHNLLLRQFGTVVADLLYLTFNMQQVVSGDRVLTRDAERHAAVFQAIDRGNGEAAAEAMLTVVLEGKSDLTRALSDARDAREAADARDAREADRARG